MPHLLLQPPDDRDMPPSNDGLDGDVRSAQWDDERRPGALPGQAHAPEGPSAGVSPDAGIPSCINVPVRDNTHLSASDWTRTLARYRQPRPSRSVFELAVTLVPFVALWAAAWWMLTISTAIALALALANAAFLVRLFIIQHDCGHGSLFRDRRLCDWIGRVLGVVTLTPYDVWRRTHAIHHASAGNLDRRGVGDIPTLTVTEYQQKGWLGQALYRTIRNPIFLFAVVPFYTFFFQNRLPVHLMRSGWRYWMSAMATNAAIALILTTVVWLGGWDVLLFVFLPTMFLAAIAGMWFFYVQHQFEETSWQHEDSWNIHEAALHGSSYYDLPRILRWITGNIGVHHVHHLASRIPFYRLPEVIADHAILAQTRHITLWESFHCARLHLWDEKHRKLLSFAEARTLAA
ncbi:fatty acid desaturase [Ruegeria sp. WL0004]|uniref:Fatty acid desaturase n=2 Tax=Ruegeria marisflavi TaxID=2984152 RepID=A0ABT2WRB7_9RHOB|nr:fatty acid desaturase [Ruegeria sp. WL0004]